MTHKILGEVLHLIAVLTVAFTGLWKITSFIDRLDQTFLVLFATVVAILAYYWNYTRVRA